MISNLRLGEIRPRAGEIPLCGVKYFSSKNVAVGFCPLGKSLFCVIRLFFVGGVVCGGFCRGLLVAFLKKSSARSVQGLMEA